MIELEVALRPVLDRGDPWQAWRARRIIEEGASQPPPIPLQDVHGGFFGASGRPSPGATGEALCHLVVLGMEKSAPTALAADWLEAARTPAQAWLDHPEEVPGELDTPGGARVWATASAACGLLAVGRHPGHRAIDLLRGEADQQGRFTGGAYPTFASAGAYWLVEGPKTEMAEWALKWAREWQEEWWGPWEYATALTFWVAAGIPADHASMEMFWELLEAEAPAEGFEDDFELTLRTVELVGALGG